MNPICSRNKPGPRSVPHWGNSCSRSQALETKLSPELLLGINQKSQNSWTTQMRVWPRAQEPDKISKGRWMCLLTPVWNQPFPRWLLNSPFISAFPTLSYCLLLFRWLLDPNVSIGLFLFITDFTYMSALPSQDPSMRKQWVHKPLTPISSAAWEKLIPILGEDRQILKPTAKTDLRIYHSSPKDRRGFLPFWAE